MAIDWKSVGEAAAKIGLPLLGAALTVPGGVAIGTALASAIGSKSGKPEDIISILTSSEEARQKAVEFERAHHRTLMQLQLDYEIKQRQADSTDIVAVNETMRAEAANSANENWWQKGWRPFNGYVVGLSSLIAVIYVCTLFYEAMQKGDAASIATVCSQVPALAMAIATILAVPGAAVGITAWHRGVKQTKEVEALRQ